jgi:hypothetical protein
LAIGLEDCRDGALSGLAAMVWQCCPVTYTVLSQTAPYSTSFRTPEKVLFLGSWMSIPSGASPDRQSKRYRICRRRYPELLGSTSKMREAVVQCAVCC